MTIKKNDEMNKLKRSNQIVATILKELQALVKPGVTSNDLDRHAEKRTIELGAVPAFKGYRGYPKSLCTSTNDVVVHGIPNDIPLKEGDIIGIDFGVKCDGFYGDSAVTVPVGKISNTAQTLIDVTRQSLMMGIEAAKAGNTIGDISSAVQTYAESFGFSVVRDFVGHGIGRSLHEDPAVPNFGKPGKGLRLEDGMALAIEPMINAGDFRVKILNDGWTSTTIDGKLSAHFEHVIVVNGNRPMILSQVDEGMKTE